MEIMIMINIMVIAANLYVEMCHTHRSIYFKNINSLNPHSNTVALAVLLSSPFYR